MYFCTQVLFILILHQITFSDATYKLKEGISACLDLSTKYENLEQAFKCCDYMRRTFEPVFETEMADQCLDIDPENWSCRKFKCLFGLGPGILIKKKDIDVAKGKEMLNNVTEKYPNLAGITDRLQRECFDRNLTQFYNYDKKCPSYNLMMCMAMHSFAMCTEFESDPECRVLEKGSKICNAEMDKYIEHIKFLEGYTTTEPPPPTPADPWTNTGNSCTAILETYRNLEIAKECSPKMQKIFYPIDQWEECLDIEPKKWSCKKFRCQLASHPGLWDQEKRKVDKEKGKEMLREIAKANPEMANLTKLLELECFEKNVSRFYGVGPCEETNTVFCLASNVLAEGELLDKELCEPLVRHAKYCKEFYDYFRKITDNIHFGGYTTMEPFTRSPTEKPEFQSCDTLYESFDLVEATKDCCQGMKKIFEAIHSNEDCLMISPGKWTCKKSRCLLASVDGLMINDMQDVNLTKASEILHATFGDNPDKDTFHMIRMLEHECIKKNVSRYYPVANKNCPAMSFLNCWIMNSFVECPWWTSGEKCQPFHEWSKTCHEMMDQVRKKTDAMEFGMVETTPTVIYPEKSTTPIPATILCSDLITDITYLNAAEYCCYPMGKIFTKTFHHDSKKCQRVTPGRWSCAKSRCILGQVPGLLVDDWFIDKERGKEVMEEIAQKYHRTGPLTKLMYHECIEKNATRFYPIENCPAFNMLYCFIINSFADCPAWNVDSKCERLIKYSKKCKARLEKIRHLSDLMHYNGSVPTTTLTTPIATGKTTVGGGGGGMDDGGGGGGTTKITKETVTGGGGPGGSWGTTRITPGEGEGGKGTATTPVTPVDFDEPKCADLHADYANVELAKYCCDAMQKVFEPFAENEGCLVINAHSWSCQKHRCLMSAVDGLIVEDNINVDVGHQMLKKIARKYPELEPMIKIMDYECFVKNVTRFYPLGQCPANSLMYCLVVNSFVECPDWTKGSGCQQAKESARNCKKTMEELRKASDLIHKSDLEEHAQDKTSTSRTTTRIVVTTTQAPIIQNLSHSKCVEVTTTYDNLELAKDCCTDMKKVFEPFDENDYCLDIEPGKWVCGKFRCLLSAIPRLLINKRFINNTVGREVMQDIAKTYPETATMAKRMEHECFVKNITFTYWVDKCEAYNYMYCLAMNAFAECTSWSDRDECKPFEVSSKKCKEEIDIVREQTDKLFFSTPSTATSTKPTTTLIPKESTLCFDIATDYETLILATQCCKAMDELFKPLTTSDLCTKMDNVWSCGKARCYLLKIPNMLEGEERRINVTAGSEMLKQLRKKHPEMNAMTNTIFKECFVKNTSEFYHMSVKCSHRNVVYCILVNSFAECPSWSDDSKCKPLKESSAKCKRQMEKERERTDVIYDKTTTTTTTTTTPTPTTTKKPWQPVTLCPDISTQYDNLDLARHCCDPMREFFAPFYRDEDCFEIAPSKWTCGKARCFLLSAEMLIKSRQVDVTAGRELMQRFAKEHPKLATMAKIVDHECFVKNASRFYPINSKCPPHNVLYCMIVNSFAECPSWSEDPKCQALKETAIKCKQQMVPERKETDLLHYVDNSEDQKTTISTGTIKPPSKDFSLCPEITTEFRSLDAARECCNGMRKIFQPLSINDLCFDVTPKIWSCGKARCMLSVANMLTTNLNHLETAASRELMKQLAEKNPQLQPMIKVIEHECIVKNATKFYPISPACQPLNVMHCILVNSFAECPSWSQDSKCKPLMEASSKCKRKLDIVRKKTDQIHSSEKLTPAPDSVVDFEKPQCAELHDRYSNFELAMSCCDPMKQILEKVTTARVCVLSDPEGWSCVKTECLLAHTGLLNDRNNNREVHQENGHKMLKELSGKYPQTAEMAKILDRECFVKNISQFYKHERCTASSLMYCLAVNSYAECPAWKKEERCRLIMESAIRCKRSIETARKESERIDKLSLTTTTIETTTTKVRTATTPVYREAFNCLDVMKAENLELAKQCCDPMDKLYQDFDSTQTEHCLTIDPNTWLSCGKVQCLMYAVPGLLTTDIPDDSQLNITVAHQRLVDLTKKYPEVEPMTKWMINECKRKLSVFPYKPLNCDSANYFYCMTINSFAECPSWTDKPSCESIKKLAMKCKPQLVEVRQISDDWLAGVYENKSDPAATCNVLQKTITDLVQAEDCCDAMKKVFEPFENKACREMPPKDQWSCAKMKCLIKLVPGLLKSTGEVNETIGHQMLDKVTKKYPDLASYIESIDKECFGKNLTVAYPVDKCPAYKLTHCLALKSFVECPSWKESPECAPYKESAQKCKEALKSVPQKQALLRAASSGEPLNALSLHSCVTVAAFLFIITF